MHSYGWLPSKKDPRDFSLRAPSLSEVLDLPSKVDLSGRDPLVLDQGSIGSCTAFAHGMLHHYCQLREGRSPFIPSMLALYYNTRLLEGSETWDAGAAPRSVLKTLSADGICPESDWPYDLSKLTQKPSPQAYTDGLKARAWRYESLQDWPFSALSGDPTGLAEMKTCLFRGHPFTFGFNVYAQFETNNNGLIDMPGPNNNTFLGGHCCLVMGYDDTHRNGDFLCKNSWGPSWGQQGFFWMPYDYLKYLGMDKWTITYEGGTRQDVIAIGAEIDAIQTQLDTLKPDLEQVGL